MRKTGKEDIMKTTRRDFLIKTTMAGAAIGFPTIIPSSVLGQNGEVPPSERVGIGLIGCGSRSNYAGQYQRYDKSQIVAVCDPRTDMRKKWREKAGNCPDYSDFRDLLENKDIDAVHIVTPDHWHIPIALAAARAGKDMYTEKPLGISINHDIKSREIVDRHKRVFQYGAQQRSMQHVRMGIELVLNGHIGDVKELYVWCPQGISGGSATPVLPVPDGFDYNMWLGPAPEAPFCNDRVYTAKGYNEKGIYHIYDYAIGFLGGWGAHPMDMLQWWSDNAGMKTIPVNYEGKGTIPTEGLFNTITRWDITCTYKNGLTLRFMDLTTTEELKLHEGISGPHGTLFVGTRGWVMVQRGGWKASSLELLRRGKDPGSKRLIVSRDQIENFVDCVISRETPVDDLYSAVRSDIICHLADIAIRRKRPITWDTKKETIVGDAAAEKMMFRELRKPWTL